MESKNRNWWPLGIVLIYGTFAVAMIGFAVFTTFLQSDLVVEDYYGETLHYQEHIDALARVHALPEAPSVEVAGGGLRLRFPVDLVSESGSPELELYRPSNKRLDQRLRLDALSADQLLTAELLPGFWKVRLSWVMQGQDYQYESTLVVPRRPS